MTQVFPGETIRAMITAAAACSLLPLIFLGYFRAKTGVKLSSFFIGMGCYFIFSFFGGSVVNTVFLSLFGLGRLLAGHPVYLSVYYALSSSVCGLCGIFFGLKYAMKNRPGKQNAFVFGLGTGGLECILYGGMVNITALVMAFLVNGLGLDAYLQKVQIPAEEIATQKQLILERAAIPAGSIYSDAILQLLSMCLLSALTVLIYQAVSHKEDFKLFIIAIALDILGYLPVYLSQADVLTNDVLTISVMTAYIFTILFFVYRFYHSNRMPS